MHRYPLNALATEENMRNIIGPRSSSSLIISSLETCESKLHWAVNTYFRHKFIYELPTDSQPTTQEQNHLGSNSSIYLGPQLHNCQPPPQTASRCVFIQKHNMIHFPLELQQKIMFYLDFKSAYLWYSTSKLQKSALMSRNDINSGKMNSRFFTESDIAESVWFKQLHYHSYIIPKKSNSTTGLMIGGRCPILESINPVHLNQRMADLINDNNRSENKSVDSISNQWYFIAGYTEKLSFYELFRLYFCSETSRKCMHCKRSSCVVPVVYGFISQPLIVQHRERRLQMGGDSLMDGSAAFTCLNCSIEFFSYPYKCCEINVRE